MTECRVLAQSEPGHHRLGVINVIQLRPPFIPYEGHLDLSFGALLRPHVLGMLAKWPRVSVNVTAIFIQVRGDRMWRYTNI